MRTLLFALIAASVALPGHVQGQALKLDSLDVKLVDLGDRSRLYNEARIKIAFTNETSCALEGASVFVKFLDADGFEVASHWLQIPSMRVGESVNLTDVANVLKEHWREIKKRTVTQDSTPRCVVGGGR